MEYVVDNECSSDLFAPESLRGILNPKGLLEIEAAWTIAETSNKSLASVSFKMTRQLRLNHQNVTFEL